MEGWRVQIKDAQKCSGYVEPTAQRKPKHFDCTARGRPWQSVLHDCLTSVGSNRFWIWGQLAQRIG
eukprot:6477351-Amphidinium_carterae.1